MPTHPQQQCDHEENRLKLCAPCGRKIKCDNRKLKYFRITEKCEKSIQNFINPNFSTGNSKYPLSVCVNCRKILAEHDNNNFQRPFKTMPNYEDSVLPRKTRASNEKIDLYVIATFV